MYGGVPVEIAVSCFLSIMALFVVTGSLYVVMVWPVIHALAWTLTQYDCCFFHVLKAQMHCMSRPAMKIHGVRFYVV